MKTISLKPVNKRPQVYTDAPLLDALLAEEINVLMACGGRGRCATCHVNVTDGMDQLSPVNDRERRTLNRLSGCGPTSRLACQARVRGEGVEVQLPRGTYVTSNSDLEALIGLRAETHILHPVTGEVLIAEGKIITRSFIMKLSDIDLAVGQIQADEVL